MTEAAELHWIMRLLLVDSWAGVSLAVFGLLAQAVFMSRMLVQWIASERAKRSVIPVAFWWLSLAGAVMLIAYGILRQDIVIILAQAFGFLVYVRNLTLIARTRRADAAADPADTDKTDIDKTDMNKTDTDRIEEIALEGAAAAREIKAGA